MIDEEHETSYQSETVPCYHARETAIERGNLEHCPVVLGSATPSVDAYYQAQNGTYRLFELNSRYENQADAEGLFCRSEERIKTGEPVDLEQYFTGKKVEERLKNERADHVVFESSRICGIFLLPFLWNSDEMSPL